MTAYVEPASWGWWCPDCGEGSELTFDDEQEAYKDAVRHDKEYHADVD